MNFYKHHIGDWDQATRHLTFVEDAAFSRMVRKYYAEEEPLPVEVRKVERLIGARTKEEKEAVQVILDEFFDLREDGWHNKRCDEELARANAQADANRKVAENREAAKRARKEQEEATKRAQEEHESLMRKEHESLRSREPSQTPDSRHQTPDLKPEPPSSPPAMPESDTDETAGAPGLGMNPTQNGAIAGALRRLGVGVAAHQDVVHQWVNDGFTVEELVEAVGVARLRKPLPAVIPGNYIDSVARNARIEKAQAKKPKRGPPWWSSDDLAIAKGKEVGIEPRVGESMDSFKQRIRARITQIEGAPA